MGLNWYVIRAISGKENKIKTYLEREIKRNSLDKFIPEVMIPYEKVYVMRNGKKKIKERHRHRYEVNIKYKEEFEKKGLIFSALSPDGMLPEIIELQNHPWFIGVQFHPEFRSRPFTPHPLFSSFVKAAEINKEKN